MTSRQSHPIEDDAVDVSQYLNVLRDHKRLLAIGLLLGFLVGVVAAQAQGPSYTATAEVVVQPIGVSDPVGNLNSDGGVNIATQQQVAQSAAVAERAKESLATDATASELLDGLTITVPGKSSVLSFAYTATDPGVAQERAQGFAEAYLETRRDNGTRTVNDLTARTQERITEVETALQEARAALAAAAPNSDEAIDAQARQDVLVSQISNLQARLGELATLVVEPGSVIQAAARPPSAGQLTRVLVVVSLTLLGLLVAAMVAFVRSRVDRRVRRPDDVERVLGVPVLATLGARPARGAPSEEVSLQVLAARLLVATRGAPGRTLALASPVAGVDTTEIASRIGKAMCLQGVRVTVVSTSSAAATVARHADAMLQHINVGRPDGTLLGPDRVQAALESARQTSTAVLLSAPGTLSSPATLLLAAEADAVVLLARTGSTGVDDLLGAASALEDMGGTIIGVVLDSAPVKPLDEGRPLPPRRRGRTAVAPEPADAR